MAGGAARKNIIERGAFGDFEGILRVADDFFEAAEEKHVDANGWYGLIHEEIVTWVQKGG